MRVLLSIISLFFISSQILAQTGTISGVVKDMDGQPIPGVRYYLKGDSKNLKKTNSNGEYSITFNIGEYDSLKFESIAFENTSLYLGKGIHRKAQKKPIIRDIYMPDRLLNIVYITPDLPDTLHGTQEYSIEDFEFMPSGDLLLLTYEKRMDKGAALRLLNKEMEVVDIHYMGNDILELQKDYRGRVHCIAKEKVYFIRQEEENIYSYLESYDYYFRYIAPMIDTVDTKLYYSNYSEVYPAFDYMEFDTKDSSFEVLMKVEDELIMELYRAEYKYVDVRTKLWAAEKQIETGIDKEIWVGATVFTNSVYYTPLYAPLFKVNENELLLFDHYKNLMFRYNVEEGIKDSVRINYHLNQRKSGWEQPLIQDEVNGKIYALFLKGGYSYLSEINQENGQVMASYKLHYKYVEEIKIIDNQVHYIYRPFESVQKKYLYTEELKRS